MPVLCPWYGAMLSVLLAFFLKLSGSSTPVLQCENSPSLFRTILKDVRVAMRKAMSEDNFGGACFRIIQSLETIPTCTHTFSQRNENFH